MLLSEETHKIRQFRWGFEMPRADEKVAPMIMPRSADFTSGDLPQFPTIVQPVPFAVCSHCEGGADQDELSKFSF